MITLAVGNRKGGAGKTTTALNLAGELSARGRRVLCVDADPQAILTLVAGLDVDSLSEERSLAAALLPENYELDLDAITHPAPWGGDIWGANSANLAGVEVTLASPEIGGGTKRLAAALRAVADRYDYALLDMPPSSGLMAYNCLVACDAVVVPTPAEFAAVAGLKRFMRTIDNVRRLEHPELRTLGVFFSIYKDGTVHARETMEQVRAQLNGMLLRTAIPERVALKDALARRQSIRQFEPNGALAKLYASLADEIEERIDG